MSAKIKLAYPFKKTDGTTCAEVTLRRPLVRDLRRMEKLGDTQAEKELALVGNLLDLAPADLDSMDSADYIVIQKQLSDFQSPRAT